MIRPDTTLHLQHPHRRTVAVLHGSHRVAELWRTDDGDINVVLNNSRWRPSLHGVITDLPELMRALTAAGRLLSTAPQDLRGLIPIKIVCDDPGMGVIVNEWGEVVTADARMTAYSLHRCYPELRRHADPHSGCILR